MKLIILLLQLYFLVLNYQQLNAESISEYNKRNLKLWKRDKDFLSVNKVNDTSWMEITGTGKKILWNLVEDGESIGEIELVDETKNTFMKLTSSVAFLRLEGEEDFSEWCHGEWIAQPADFNKKLFEWKFNDFPDLYFRKLSDTEWVDDEGIRYEVARDNERIGELVLFTSKGYYEWKKLTPHDLFYSFEDKTENFKKGLKGRWL